MTASTIQTIGNIQEYTTGLPNGVKVRTLEAGTGPVLLLLHGNPDNADEWKTLIDLLRNDYHCIAPDLPGYGPRETTYALPHNFDYSIQAQVGFIDAFLAHLNIQDKITLVVHDIGGIMGVPWAAQNLDRLNAVVYTNTAVFSRFQWFDLAIRWGKESVTGRGAANLSMNALGWFNGWLFRRVFAKQHPLLTAAELDRFVRDFALNSEAKRTTLRQFRQLTKPGFFDSYDKMLKSISESVPTLAVWGADDPYISDSFTKELLAQKTIILPNIGHWVPIVAADSLAQHIRSLRGKA